MIETPRILETDDQHTAVIRLTVPREQIHQVMGPGIEELFATVAAQGGETAGVWFTRHFRLPDDIFDFEIGVPVVAPIRAAGRVTPSTLPAQTVARALYPGNYDGLPQAWGAFQAWLEKEGHATRSPVWESYVLDPSTNADPASWRTELNWPLAEQR